MTGVPRARRSPTPASCRTTALRSAAGEPFIVPSQGKNVAGGKELLRIMLSKEAATNFAKTKLAPTIVKGTVPGRRLRLDRAGVAERRCWPPPARTSSTGSSSTCTA